VKSEGSGGVRLEKILSRINTYGNDGWCKNRSMNKEEKPSHKDASDGRSKGTLNGDKKVLRERGEGKAGTGLGPKKKKRHVESTKRLYGENKTNRNSAGDRTTSPIIPETKKVVKSPKNSGWSHERTDGQRALEKGQYFIWTARGKEKKKRIRSSATATR